MCILQFAPNIVQTVKFLKFFVSFDQIVRIFSKIFQFRGVRPQTLYRSSICPWTPLGDFCPPNSLRLPHYHITSVSTASPSPFSKISWFVTGRRRVSFRGSHVNAASLLMCLRTHMHGIANNFQPKCTRLHYFAYTISKFFLGVVPGSPRSAPVLWPRYQFPLGSPAFPFPVLWNDHWKASAEINRAGLCWARQFQVDIRRLAAWALWKLSQFWLFFY